MKDKALKIKKGQYVWVNDNRKGEYVAGGDIIDVYIDDGGDIHIVTDAGYTFGFANQEDKGK